MLTILLLAGSSGRLHAQKEWNVYQPFGPTLLWSVAYGPTLGEYVAVGPERQVAWDVDISVLQDRSSENLAGAYSVALGGESVVVGQVLQEGIGYSTDRQTWSQYLVGESFWGVAHGNGRYVVVGSGGRVAVASDALDDWSNVVVENIATNLYAICFAQDLFLTGNEGKMLTSVDGTEWEVHEGGFTGSVRSMAYGRDRFVMVGSAGAVWISDDGQTWSLRSTGTTSSLRSVVFGHGLFVAVGGNGTVIYSIDRGESWVAAKVGTAQQINSVTFGQGMFHAVTSGGQVLASRSIMTPPAIVVDLADQEVLAGSNVYLEVSASGTAPLSYSWSFDGEVIGSSDSSRLGLPDVSEAQEGVYQVTVFNPAGAITGRPAFLNILPIEMPPEILIQPTSVAGVEGGRIELSVEADGTAPLIYRWFKGSRWLSEITGHRLVLDPAGLGDSGRYSVMVSNGFGEVRSREVVVSIEPSDRVPEILSQPAGGSVVAGQSFELRVTDRAWPPATYQWYLDEEIISGENGAGIRFSPLEMTDAGRYHVRVSNALGSIDSDRVGLTVTRPLMAPVVVMHPEDLWVARGGQFQLSAAIDGHPTPTLQWFRDSEVIAGETGAELQVTAAQDEDSGDYWIRATNERGLAESRHARVVVDNGWPQFLEVPASIVIELGKNLSLSIQAAGPGPLIYRWWHDGVEITGLSGPDLVSDPVGYDDSGRYEVEVINAFGSIRSEPFQITVLTIEGEKPVAYLLNTSLRGRSGQGADTMITGFVLEGSGQSPVLVRGIGPGLRRFQVADALEGAVQKVFRDGVEVAPVGAWDDPATRSLVESRSILAGALPLDPETDDTAL
ncbi:MAG: hypothetical protein DRP71_17260, partial [Verrucomicrobia bacterium]